jgi:hypothetical protein
MRHITTAVAVATIGMLVAACGSSKDSGPASSSTKTTTSTTTTTPSKPPLAQAALVNLMLSPTDIDGALGVTGTTITDKTDALQEDKTADAFPGGYKFPTECLYVTGAGLVPVYAGSGNTAVHRERASASVPGSNDPDPEATQVVVLFPSSKEANAFFTTSSQGWPACANRQDTVPASGDSPQIEWKVGAVSTANGTLSTTVTVTASKNGTTMFQACQRALTVRNNVVIDVEACRKDPGDVAVNIAGQIGGKVDNQ